MDIGKRTRKESSSSSSSISEWTRNYRWPMNAIKKNRVSISPQVCEDGSSSKVEDEDDDEDEKEWEPCQARAFLAIPRRAVMNHHTPYHSARSPFGSTELTCAQASGGAGTSVVRLTRLTGRFALQSREQPWLCRMEGEAPLARRSPARGTKTAAEPGHPDLPMPSWAIGQVERPRVKHET